MSDLPPDAARLRAILRYLEDQAADNETVGVYLRLQRDTVLKALADAERSQRGEGGEPARAGEKPAARPAVAVPTPTQSPRRPGKPYKLERRPTADGPLPTAVHTADCHMAGELAHAVNAMEARLAITDSGLPACPYCRPDTELGIDQD